mmetsp:Transcript_5226/g.32880  ORF Transcript_5226/g.32880 Transcript_5226/m.32880 type:complete len:187 (+) Transcript_5226:79-639(+)
MATTTSGYARICGMRTSRSRGKEVRTRRMDGRRGLSAGKGETTCTTELLDALVPQDAWHTKHDSTRTVLELRVRKQQEKIEMLERSVEDLLLCAIDSVQNGETSGNRTRMAEPLSAKAKNTSKGDSNERLRERMKKLEAENQSLRRRDAMRTEFVRRSRELLVLQLKKSGQLLEEVHHRELYTLTR